jgi:hypothetical protein
MKKRKSRRRVRPVKYACSIHKRSAADEGGLFWLMAPKNNLSAVLKPCLQNQLLPSPQ